MLCFFLNLFITFSAIGLSRPLYLRKVIFKFYNQLAMSGTKKKILAVQKALKKNPWHFFCLFWARKDG